MKIGILGGGQLARMLAESADKLQINTVCVDPDIECSARQVTTVHHCQFSELDRIQDYFSDVDCVTFETENLPYTHIEKIAQSFPILPNINALKITQDRLLEKQLFTALNIPTPEYYAINNWDDLINGTKQLGFPCVLKTRRSGYDGKGQTILKNINDAEAIWEQFSSNELILEKFIHYDLELSIIAVRSRAGEIRYYPLTKNHHVNGILRISYAPYVDAPIEQSAIKYISEILEKFNYAGTMAIEFFCQNGALIANEIAPRVHNSGHWTIEGADTSQFENHLRAISGLPLGSTKLHYYSAMINCIGKLPTDLDSLLKTDGIYYHSYNKAERENRKLGHITICAQTQSRLNELIKSSADCLKY